MHLSGSITALATPFTAAGDLDLDAWARLIDRQVAGGSRGIVVAGSTGEAAMLTDAEYSILLRAAVDQAGDQLDILAGTGQSGTARTIAQTRLARDGGADAALVVTPPYVRPTQDGLVSHYTAVAEQGGLPVVLYNVPGRTGCDLLPETVARLHRHPSIIGLKEARGDEARWDALYPLGGADFALLSGDDPTFLRAMLGGARGVVSVASNVVPTAFSRICRLAAAGDGAAARVLDARLQGLYDFLGVEPNPVPVKALLARLGLGHGLRLPLLPLSAGHNAGAEAMAALCQAIEHELQ